MFKRMKLGLGTLAGLAALGLGGAALAGATSSSTAKTPAKVAAPEVTSQPDADNVQSGDQSAPDTAASASKTDTATAGERTDTPSEQATSESSSNESASASDGPGGYADAPGNSNADTQQQGQN